MSIYVIDVGTSSMRGILYDNQASILHQTQVQYTPNYLPDNWVEQDPADWRNALLSLCKELADHCHPANKWPDAIAMTAQRSSILVLDAEGTPMAPAIMWQDKRTIPYVKEFSAKDDFIFQKTGSRCNPVFSGTKMVWVRKERPELYKHASKLAVIPDYLLSIMTGHLCTDHTYGSRSLLMNLKTRTWDTDLLSFFGLEEEKLCELIAPGSVAGKTNASFSKLTGLPTGIPVISAGGDQQCAALGLGVIGHGDTEVTVGTGAFIQTCCKQLPDLSKPDIICGASAIPGYYSLESSILTCCSAFDWFLRTFYPECSTNDFEKINSEIALSPPGSNGVITLPYFQGRATPDWNSEATASFLNLSLAASRGDLARSLIEGIGYEINTNLASIRHYTGSITDVKICGGLSNSQTFNQLTADISQNTLHKYSNSEATALGAWMSAAVTIGLCKDYHSAFTTARATDQTTTYTPVFQTIYEEGYARFTKLYQSLYSDLRKLVI